MIDEQVEILRRIAERGKLSMERCLGEHCIADQLAGSNIDTYIHLLDEIERLKNMINQTNTQ